MTMRVNTSAFLTGMREAVGQASDAVSERGLRRVGYAGAAVLRDEAKQNAAAHVDTGTVLRNIITKHIDEKSDGARLQTYYVMVRAGKFNQDGDAFYWRFVENGHKIVRRKKRNVGWKRHRELEQMEFGDKRVPPKPFMRPAYDAKRQAATDAMQAELARVLAEGAGDT